MTKERSAQLGVSEIPAQITGTPRRDCEGPFWRGVTGGSSPYHFVSGDTAGAAQLLVGALYLQHVAHAVAAVAVASAVLTAVHGQVVGEAEAGEAGVAAELVHGSLVVHLMPNLKGAAAGEGEGTFLAHCIFSQFLIFKKQTLLLTFLRTQRAEHCRFHTKKGQFGHKNTTPAKCLARQRKPVFSALLSNSEQYHRA